MSYCKRYCWSWEDLFVKKIECDVVMHACTSGLVYSECTVVRVAIIVNVLGWLSQGVKDKRVVYEIDLGLSAMKDKRL